MRQPIANVPGMGETSFSAARPVDAFAGAPQAKASTQLADAFAAAGQGFKRAGQQAEAKREQERLDLMALEAEGTARKMIAESESGFLTAVQLGEAYADLSDAIVARIVINENNNAFYDMARDKLSGLDDGTIMNKATLDSLYSQLESEAISATDGFAHAQSGALSGVRRAVREMSGQHASARDRITRQREGLVVAGQINQAIDSAMSIGEDALSQAALQSKIEGQEPLSLEELRVQFIADAISAIDLEPSSYDNVGRKINYVQGLINWDINNPDKDSITQRVMDIVPWLKGDLTEGMLAQAEGDIFNAKYSYITRMGALEDEMISQQLSLREADLTAIVTSDTTVTEQYAALDDLEAKYRDDLNEMRGKGPGDPGFDATALRLANESLTRITTVRESLSIPQAESSANQQRMVADLQERLITATLQNPFSREDAIQFALDYALPMQENDRAYVIANIDAYSQGLKDHSDTYKVQTTAARAAAIESVAESNLGIGSPQRQIIEQLGGDLTQIAADTFSSVVNDLTSAYISNYNEMPSLQYLEEVIHPQANASVTTLLDTVEAATESTQRQVISQVTATGGDLTQDPTSPYFEPRVGKIYEAPNGQGLFTYLGNDPERVFEPYNWGPVNEDGSPRVVSPSRATTTEVIEPQEPATVPNQELTVEDNRPDLEEEVSEELTGRQRQRELSRRSKREKELEAYEGLEDIFDYENQVFTLEAERLNEIVSGAATLPVNRRTGLPTERVLKNFLAEALNVADNSYFTYGGLDRPQEDGEIALQKLVERVRELLENQR